jgi:EpsI family protein
MVKRASLLLVIFLVGGMGVLRANRPEQAPPRTSFERFPLRFKEWSGQELAPIDKKIMAILRVDDYVNRVYSKQNRDMAALYIGYYKSQRQGDAIHSPLNCLPGAGWEPISKAGLTIPLAVTGALASISVNRYVIQKGLDRQLVLYWYQSHGRVVASEYVSKIYLVRDAVRLNRTDAALVRVIVPMEPQAADAEGRAEAQAVDFVKAMFPALPQYLPS